LDGIAVGLRLDGDADGDLVGVVDGVLVDGIVVGVLDGEEDNFVRVGDAVGIVDGLIVGLHHRHLNKKFKKGDLIQRSYP
jgi:hypothetical protein